MKLYYPASVLTALGALGTSPAMSSPFPANFELSSLTNATGKAGAVIYGEATSDFSGFSVHSAGDVNGDGFDDFIIGAPQFLGAATGRSYVIFGKKGGFDPRLELSSLNGSNGFKLNGIDQNDYAGSTVSSAGDVNGDGFDDLIIGARRADPNGKIDGGESYVVFGKKAPFSASLELTSLNGSNGFKLNGIDPGDYSGSAVSSAGDVNGDGFDDLIIGALRADPNGKNAGGESYVVFGKKVPFSASLELSSLNGSNGFKLNGIDPNDRSGRSLSSAGDVNGDGFDDLLIGAFNADPNGKVDAGESYVVFGKKVPFSASLELSSLNGSNGFKLNGIDPNDRSGFAVSSAGDVNGDGFDDLIIGAYRAAPNGKIDAGESYVVFGKKAPFNSSLELNSLNGSNGFKLNGIDPNDFSGSAISSLGDINGDGFDDLIIGASSADPNGKAVAGESYVVFGKKAPFSASLELSSFNGSNGFKLNGIEQNDYSGFSVSTSGDVNGDGIDDLIIGAYHADPNGKNDAGESYVIYGHDESPQGDFTANCAPDLLIGKGKVLRILPLTINSNQGVNTELPVGSDLALPIEIAPNGNKLSPKTKLLTALDFDDAGVTDFLVKEGKDKLKLFKLENNGLPFTPTVLSEVDFTLPKKHHYLGAGPFTAKKSSDNKLDLMLKKGKELFVVENLGESFSTELRSLTGKLEKGKVLSIQKGRVILLKGKKISQQTIADLALGTKTELGTLAKNQKPLLMLDINQDGKLDIVTQGKKRSIGFVSEDNISATPTTIVTLSKGQKVVGPK